MRYRCCRCCRRKKSRSSFRRRRRRRRVSRNSSSGRSANAQAGNQMTFGMVPEGCDHAVGLVQVRAIAPRFSVAEWGFAVGSPFWGTGLFLASARMTLDFAFQTHRGQPSGSPRGRAERPRQRRAAQARRRAGRRPSRIAVEGRQVSRSDHVVDRRAGLVPGEGRVERGSAVDRKPERPNGTESSAVPGVRHARYRGHHDSGAAADRNQEGRDAAPSGAALRRRCHRRRGARPLLLRHARPRHAVGALPLPDRPVVPRVDAQGPSAAHTQRVDDVGVVRRRLHRAAAARARADRVRRGGERDCAVDAERAEGQSALPDAVQHRGDRPHD